MKITKILLVLLLSGVSFIATSQKEMKPIKRISLQDISIQTGMFSESASIGGTLTDFNSLSPQSILLNTMSFNFDSVSSFGYSSLSAGPMFSALLGFQFCNKEKTGYKSNVQLKLGGKFFYKLSFFRLFVRWSKSSLRYTRFERNIRFDLYAFYNIRKLSNGLYVETIKIWWLTYF